MSLREPEPSGRVIELMQRKLLKDRIYPQRLYALGLKDLVAKHIEGAKSRVWRFTAELGGGDMALDVSHSGRGMSPKMASFSRGRHVTQARNAMRKVVAWKEVKEHDYELRLLSIPDLAVEAVWVKSRSRMPDLVLPYTPTDGLTKKQYRLDEFLEILKPAALNRLKADRLLRVRR